VLRCIKSESAEHALLPYYLQPAAAFAIPALEERTERKRERERERKRERESSVSLRDITEFNRGTLFHPRACQIPKANLETSYNFV